MSIRLFTICSLLIVSCFSCNSCNDIPIPKPRGFIRIDFPEKKYSNPEQMGCPFLFEIPQYSELVADSGDGKEPCRFNWTFQSYNAIIHLSYKNVSGNLGRLIEDSRTLVYKHSIKASSIDENRVSTANNVYGIVYRLGGQSASTIQFFLTDSMKHFLRGALYFNVETQPDSLQPVIEFINKDINHMMATLEWK